MSLDINTPKGRESLSREQYMLERLSKLTGWKFIQTPKGRPSSVDGFAMKEDEIKVVFESKCRSMDLQDLKRFHNEWLISYDKITKGIFMSKELHVPYYGFLLLGDKSILTIQITDDDGNVIAPMRLDVTVTQATCNGGKASRTNAYISMHKAKLWQ